MELLLFIIIIILVLIIVLLFCKKSEYESFDNQNSQPVQLNMQNISDNKHFNNSYLYPTKKLSGICKEQGLKPSYMPKACYIDGNLNSYANCKCEDEKGNCKICYPEIKKDSKNSSVVYNATFS